MKKIVGILLTSTLLTSAALANAGPAPAPACPEVAAPKWGGFKLGAQLGYGHSAFRASDDGSTATMSMKGVIGGLHAGYDYQAGKSMILGVNTSFDLSGLKGNIETLKFSNKWTIAVVPRVGIVMQDSLLYAGAGWAASKLKSRDSNDADFNGSKTVSALRLQMGAAQKMNKVLMGAEVNYDFYGKKFAAKQRVLTGMLKVSYMM